MSKRLSYKNDYRLEKAPLSIKQYFHLIFLIALISLMMIPVVATGVYAVSGDWSQSILPESWTIKWLLEIWTQERFLWACFYSLVLCIGSAILSIILIFPVLLIVHTRKPQWQRWINFILILPFTVPPIVASISILDLYSGILGSKIGTTFILIGCYFTIVLPFVYRSLDNNFRAIGVKDLIESANLLGASTPQIIAYILLPNLKPGFIVAFFISIAFLIGEFVYVNILIGGHFETIQTYLFNLKNQSGHLSSAVVISYFCILIIITAFINGFSNSQIMRKK
ncbi:ABC transporter permease [Moraxella catarrhalis]|uniref:ABC transporter permease n=1 Tax=Moraxella catarrhalis TaxID=480 RepID=UPI000EAA9FB9|nr:ABC transporter permease subunit [Moraxella catarrhalis]RKL89255.1 ABC transporter permease subunit [Moraxella catarrhalis]